MNRHLFILTGLTTAVFLCLSGHLLNSIYSYSLPGGAFPEKIHPGSYLAMGCVTLIVIRQGLVATIHRHARSGLWNLQFLIVVAAITIINVIRFGSGGTAYIIDTFLAASLLLLLAFSLSPEQRYKITELILYIVFLNSIIAVLELLLRTNLIPHSNEFGAAYFRAAGLFGHPLGNGLITAPLLPLILLTQWSPRKKAIVSVAFMLSILASGARGALIIGVPVFLAALALIVFQDLWRHRLRADVGWAVPWALIVGVGLFAYLVLETSFGARFMERGLSDDNATARINSFKLFTYLSYNEIWSGIDMTYYQILLDKYPDIGIVENFWVNLIVSFGIPLFVVFSLSFAWFFWGMCRAGGSLVGLAAVSFVLIASTNNSLSSKCVALIIFAVAVCGLSQQRRPMSMPVVYPVRFSQLSGVAKDA